MKRICRLATVPFFLQLHLRSQLLATVNEGYDVTLVCAQGPEVNDLKDIPNIAIQIIDIPRVISPWRDLVALWKLYRFFLNKNFDIVHSTTPKAGMLGAIAARLAGIPIRLHTFTGQPWMELKGSMRLIAKMGDWLTSHLNTMCYADSASQRDFLIEQRVAAPERLKVIGSGSLAGVDIFKFDTKHWMTSRGALLKEIGINQGESVITFVGRLTKDKGISELVAAIEQLHVSGHSCVLLLVGPLEPERDPLPENTQKKIRESSFIRVIGYSPMPEKYLSITDILCLPSYREGFGNVVVEAAAMGVPTVGTDIIGLQDSIVDGQTGLLVRPKDAVSLASGLKMLLDNPKIRLEMGEKAMIRARQDFDAIKVNAEVLVEYDRLVKMHLKQPTI